MSKLNAARGAQYLLTAIFEFLVTDTMVNINGVEQALNTDGTFVIAKLPPNAVVVGGAMTVLVASNDTGAATIAIGDSGSAARYLGATSIKTAARTALVPTGYAGTGEDLRMSLVDASDDATAGQVRVEVEYIIKNRQNETQTN